MCRFEQTSNFLTQWHKVLSTTVRTRKPGRQMRNISKHCFQRITWKRMSHSFLIFRALKTSDVYYLRPDLCSKVNSHWELHLKFMSFFSYHSCFSCFKNWEIGAEDPDSNYLKDHNQWNTSHIKQNTWGNGCGYQNRMYFCFQAGFRQLAPFGSSDHSIQELKLFDGRATP